MWQDTVVRLYNNVLLLLNFLNKGIWPRIGVDFSGSAGRTKMHKILSKYFVLETGGRPTRSSSLRNCLKQKKWEIIKGIACWLLHATYFLLTVLIPNSFIQAMDWLQREQMSSIHGFRTSAAEKESNAWDSCLIRQQYKWPGESVMIEWPAVSSSSCLLYLGCNKKETISWLPNTKTSILERLDIIVSDHWNEFPMSRGSFASVGKSYHFLWHTFTSVKTISFFNCQQLFLKCCMVLITSSASDEKHNTFHAVPIWAHQGQW